MKTNTLLAPIVLALFAFVRVMLGQDYLLPIGSNLDNRTNHVYIQFRGGTSLARDRFDYDPSMGPLREVIDTRAKTLAKSFKPMEGYEDSPDYLFLVDTDYAGYSVHFGFNKVVSDYVVPESLFDFKLNYGGAARWYLPGITAIDMDVETVTGQQHFSSREWTGGSYCFLSAQSGSFEVGWALIGKEYAVPWLQAETGVLAGSTVTLWQDDRYVTFNMLDGSFVGSSDEMPDFIPYLLRPTVPPKVTGLRLRDGLAEISVSTGTARYFVVEYSTDFTGESWELVAFSYVGSATQKVIHYPPAEAQSGFYRVRIPPPSFVKSSGAKIAGKP